MNRYDFALGKPKPDMAYCSREKSSFNKTKKGVVDKILDQALFEHMNTNGRGRDREPGKLIRRLPSEERELLEGVTTEDFNHRIFI